MKTEGVANKELGDAILSLVGSRKSINVKKTFQGGGSVQLCHMLLMV